MSDNHKPHYLLPVTCKVCGESQNTIHGGFSADGLPAGSVNCMVCGHTFEAEEYAIGLNMRREEFTRLSGPDIK